MAQSTSFNFKPNKILSGKTTNNDNREQSPTTGSRRQRTARHYIHRKSGPKKSDTTSKEFTTSITKGEHVPTGENGMENNPKSDKTSLGAPVNQQSR